MADQPQLEFNNLPTEALFSFFFALDPLTIGKYSAVCKRWSQLCKDNELWRQYCLRRWEKNPKEADCSRNWLIPVREGSGQKETRIDWKKAYMLRDIGDKAKHVVDALMGGNQKLAFLKKTSKKNTDPFAKGWPTIEDLLAFDKRALLAWRKASEYTGEDQFPFSASELHEKFMHIIDFYFEMELLMLKQSTAARQKYLLMTSNLLRKFCDFIKEMIVVLPGRLAKTASEYVKIAREKDIPLDIVVKHLESCAKIFAAMNETTPLKYFAPSYFEDISRFILSVVNVMATWPLDEAFDKWVNEFVDAEATTSPTYDLEECIDNVSFSLRADGKFVYNLLKQTVASLGATDTPRKLMTVMGVIVGFASGCKEYIGQNLNQFMEEFFFPYFEPLPDPKDAIPMLYYSAGSLFYLDREVDTVNETRILTKLLKMTDVKSDTFQKQICNFIISYCDRIVRPDFMLPFMRPLLETFYGYLKSENIDLRVDAILAISSLIITCASVFDQYRERLTKELKDVMFRTNGEKKTREAVVEAMARIGAGVANSNISAELESTYEQMIEEYKKDRHGNEETFVKMTEFFITALGPRFEKYMAFVFPIILEQINLNVIENVDPAQNNHANNQNNNGAVPAPRAEQPVEGEESEDEEMALGDEPEIKVNNLQAIMKKSALNALHTMIEELSVTALAPLKTGLYDTIVSILRGDNTIECMILSAEILYEYTLKFEGAANKTNRAAFLNDAVLVFLNTLIIIESMADRARMLFWFNQIIVHLITTEPDEEPVLTKVTTRVLVQTITQCMQLLHDDASIEERKDFSTELANMFEFICKNLKGEARTDFFEISKELFEYTMHGFSDAVIGYDERWFEVSLMVITFEHLGDLFKDSGYIMKLLPVLELCGEIDSEEIKQAVAYHFGVMARKYPSYLPPDDGEAYFKWLFSVLTPEVRVAAPSLYDNALVSAGHILEYWHKKGQSIATRLPHFIAKFPPTENGDKAEGVTCLEILGRLSTANWDLIKASPNLASEVAKVFVVCSKIADFEHVANTIMNSMAKL